MGKLEADKKTEKPKVDREALEKSIKEKNEALETGNIISK